MSPNWEEYRNRIIGLGEHSLHKSYFPELQKQIDNLKLSQKNQQTILDSLNDGIIIHDTSGKIISINARTKEIFNLKEQDIACYTIYDITSPNQDTSQFNEILTKAQNSTPQIIEWLGIQLETLQEIPLQISINPSVWYDKPVLVSVVRDFTERKNFEKELIAAKEKAEESNQLKNEFLNNMSHEVRTPMNGIIGFTEMLEEPDLSDETRKYYLKIVQNSCYQLLKIIDDILEISSLKTKQSEINEVSFCIDNLLKELFSLFSLKSKERKIPIYIKAQNLKEKTNIITDKNKLTKILTNLLENALKFTHQGYIEIGYFLEVNKIKLYVKDTGIGISPENINKIFDRFSQEEKDLSRQYGGLGLGLSISRENAILLGGDITIESKKGEGSTFYVIIPYKPSNNSCSNEIQKDTVNVNDSAQNYTILIAEDEEVNFLFFEALLESRTNIKLIHAKNGQEAIDICFGNKDIDLILMDIKMPILNGYEATEIIKSKLPNLPIIAQTAYSTIADRNAAKKHGCDDFISKPISREELFALIDFHLISKSHV